MWRPHSPYIAALSGMICTAYLPLILDPLFRPQPSIWCDVAALSSRIKARAIAAAKNNQGVGGKQIEGGASSIGTVSADTSPSAGGVKAGRNNGTGSPLHESPSSSSVEKGLPSRPSLVLGDKQEAKSNHFTAIAVCVAGAVMSSMLQFSFVYGAQRSSRSSWFWIFSRWVWVWFGRDVCMCGRALSRASAPSDVFSVR